MRLIQEQPLIISWLIALIALLTTLYLSEILLWPVCHLCWYQRICLYPQVILLGIAAFNNDRSILPYTLVLSSLGLIFAIYQYLMQLFPITFEGISLCGAGPSCATIHIHWLGFMTLPLISAAGFFILVIIQAIGKQSSRSA
jgi:disulfide bond formation protein DsbB